MNSFLILLLEIICFFSLPMADNFGAQYQLWNQLKLAIQRQDEKVQALYPLVV